MPEVRLLGALRRGRGERLVVDGRSVAEVLRALPEAGALFLPDGSVHPDVEVLVNGRNIAFLRGLETPVSAGDRLTVFVHGARGYPGG